MPSLGLMIAVTLMTGPATVRRSVLAIPMWAEDSARARALPRYGPVPGTGLTRRPSCQADQADAAGRSSRGERWEPLVALPDGGGIA
jgi:hypothetical protein